jgi:hypothetical protein
MDIKMTEKKKKKSKSLSAQIQRLRERLSDTQDYNTWLLNQKIKKEDKIEYINQLFPKFYYEITYKCKAQSGEILEYKRTFLSIHPELVRLDVENKKYENYEFISIRQLTGN